jgi:anti-sigma regulatory factor (Ser/Thr protein kinase)
MTEGAPALNVMVPADAANLAALRELVAAFARSYGADSPQIDSMVLAVNEACGNVVRHAYGPEGGPLHLKGAREGAYLQFLVSDNGTPVADPGVGSGAKLGLKLIYDLSDDVDVEGPGPHGTRVRMTFALRGEQAGQHELPDFRALS